jgi:Fe-S cluster biogenesis protein NfuA
MMSTTETPSTEMTPEATTEATVTIDRDRVLAVLDAVRPYLQADGGDVELVDITSSGTVLVRLQGACGTCPSSTYTLKMGIEEQLRQNVPGFVEVIAVA